MVPQEMMGYEAHVPSLYNEDKYSSSDYHGYRCSFIVFKTSKHEAYHSSKSKMNDII